VFVNRKWADCGRKPLLHVGVNEPGLFGRYGFLTAPIRINSGVFSRPARFDSLALDPVSLNRANVESSIQVGVNGPTVWVKVEGKGSFLNSGNLKEFAREMLDRGYREFVIDLADCAMMDSTFMGTMASVALRLKELGRGHLHVVHCRNRSRELLSGLGLDQIFDIHANGATAPECETLEHGDRSRENQKREQAETMLEAHEALCEAAPENLFRFKDVLDYLKQDLHHETPSK
jgi:anti-sigma B factor antagonist